MHRFCRAVPATFRPIAAIVPIIVTCLCLNSNIILGGIAPASADAQPDQPRLPELTGQSVFRWSEWRALNGAPLASAPPFVQPQGGQEIALRVHDVKPGAYYLRACVETGANMGEEELANTDSAMLFLNGKAVCFGRATPIVPFGKTNVAVIESARPITVRDGDEIRWNVANRAGRYVGGVALSQTPLAFAPIDVSPIYDTDLDDQVRLTGAFIMPTPQPPPVGSGGRHTPVATGPEGGEGKNRGAIPAGVHAGGLVAEGDLRLTVTSVAGPKTEALPRKVSSSPLPPVGGAGGGQFHYAFTNVTGLPARFEVKVTVLDFWQKPVAEQTETVTLDDRKDYAHDLTFARTDSDRYRAVVSIRGPGLDKLQEFETLVDNPAGPRPRMWLNDGWQWTSIKDDGTMATRTIGGVSRGDSLTGWQEAKLPASWQENSKADHIAWYRRDFTLPDWLQGKRLFLHIERANEEARVFVNGVEVGRHFGHGGPFEFEVTDAVKPGANHLVIGVRDAIAALTESELSAPSLDVNFRSQFRSPNPWNCLLAEMWLYGAPSGRPDAPSHAGAPPIRDVFVSTSFRRKRIDLRIQPPAVAAGHKAVLSNRVLYLGKEVLRFPDVPLIDSSPETVTVSQSWPDPILWNPGDPRLLQLVTEVRGDDGVPIDRMDTRFGFREFWPDGNKMIWNGRPIKLVANSFLDSTGWGISYRGTRDATRKELLASKRFGIFMHRHLSDPEYRIEMNDEEGIPVAWELGGVVNPTQQIIQSDEFWKNAAIQNVEAVTGLRNHPSIVTWYLSNEFHGADTAANRERLQALGRTVAAVDSTRTLEFGCDLDLGGFSPIISTHYPVDYPALYDERAFFPDAAYWHPIDRKLQLGQHVPDGIVKGVANVAGESVITWGYKPIVINETLWTYFFSPPDGLTRLVGDASYAGPAATERAIKTASAWFVRGHRDAGAAIVEPWEWIYRDPVGTYFPQIDINPVQRYAHFFGGRTVPFDVNLHCDRFAPTKLTFAWKLVNGSVVLRKSSTPLAFDSGELKRLTIAVPLPSVARREQLQLQMMLLENGVPVRTVSLPIDVCPREAVRIPAGVKIGLYDPAGTARGVMAAFAGTQPRSLDSMTAQSLAGLDILIVGENAAQMDDPAARAALDDFIGGGGRALVLRQDKSPELLSMPLVSTNLTSSQLLSFYPAHPFFAGIESGDFSFWYPGHRVASSLYVKPGAGNSRTLLESGGPKGMVYAALVEHPQGRGVIVCSQLDLTEHLSDNPIAGMAWQALLDYLAKPPAPRPQAGYWGAADSDLGRSISSLRADLKPVSGASDLAGIRSLVLDGSAPLGQADITALRAFVTGGGKLLVHGVTPANRDAVSALCGGLRVTAPGPHSWDGRAIHTAQSDLSAGLTNYDLFWRHRPDTENYSEAFYRESSMLAPLGAWTLEAEHGWALTYPAYLVEVPLGQGRILLDNIAWDKPGDSVTDHARHIASVLLTDLGVRLDTGAKLRVPDNLSYRPVDLSGVLNRAFADEKAEDGQGGWTDQGPDSDLREFPTAKAVQTFDGVPFNIGKGNSVLVLASPNIRGNLPKEIDLPFAGKADVLFFLQSEAWCGDGPQWSYIVHYANGLDYEIKVAGGVNIRDWASPDFAAPFPFETDTVTRAAWTGHGPKFADNTLYDMAWPNPHPEIPIRGITFRGAGQGIPILVALTAATSNTQASPTAVAPIAASAVPAAIRARFEEGRKLAKAGNAAGATAAFRDVIAAAPGWSDPYLALGYITDREGEWANSVQTYQQLLAFDPDNLEALSRLGKADEELGNRDEAEKVYRHSLEINPNQPEVLRALHQLPAE